MTLGKSFQTIIIFIVIPLMLAVQSQKLTLTAALDLIVWYIAISFGVFIFKTPIKLYYIVKEKSKILNERKEYLAKEINDAGEDKPNVTNTMLLERVEKSTRELYSLEWRLLITSITCPILALMTWYGLEKMCTIYSLSSLSQLLHPYFVIIAGFVSTYQPIFYFINNLAARLDDIHPYGNSTPPHAPTYSPSHISPPTMSPRESYDQLKFSTDRYFNTDMLTLSEERLKQVVQSEFREMFHQQQAKVPNSVQNLSTSIKQIQNEMIQLKKDIKDWAQKRTGEVTNIDQRVLSLENQVELIQLVNENTNPNFENIRTTSTVVNNNNTNINTGSISKIGSALSSRHNSTTNSPSINSVQPTNSSSFFKLLNPMLTPTKQQ